MWAVGHRQEGGAGPGCLPAPGNVFTALEAASMCTAISRPSGPNSAVPGPCTSSTGGAVSLCWGSSWCHEGRACCSPISVGRAERLDPSLWSQEQCPSRLSPPVALSGLMTGCPEQRAVLSAACGCLLCASSALSLCPFPTWAVERAGEHLPMAIGTFWGSVWAAGPILSVLEQLQGQAQPGSCWCLGPWPCWNSREEILPEPRAAWLGTQRCPSQGQSVP